MSRILVAILLLFATFAVMVQGVMAFELNLAQTLIAEEETHDDKPGKSNKENKEKYLSIFTFHQHLANDQLARASFMNDLRFSKGFTLIPYMPPDRC